MAEPDAWREYEAALGLMNEEATRAWTRISIFVSLEAAVLAGFLTGGDALLARPALLWILYTPVTFLALATSLIIWTGRCTSRAITKVILRTLEDPKLQAGKPRLLGLATGEMSGWLWRLHYTATLAMAVAFSAAWIGGIPALLLR